MLAAGGIGRVVVREDHRALEVVRLHPSERRLQIVELRVADMVVGDHARILQRVAVEREDAGERRLEGEEHPGLNLRGA